MKLFLLLLYSIVSLMSYSATNLRQPTSDSPVGRALGSSAELELALQDSAAAKPSLFIAIFSLGPNWKTDKPAHEQTYFKEHSANLKKWRAEKKIVLGARYSGKGMIIISAADEKEARALVEHDPMVMNKVFNLELYPFSPFYIGCIQ